MCWVIPVFAKVMEVRKANRAKLGGFEAPADHVKAREKTDKSLADLETFLANRQQDGQAKNSDPLDLAPSVAKLEAAWQATASAGNGADSDGRTVFEPVTAALSDLLVKVGDDANLVPDPDIDSFYLVNALVLTMPTAAEEVGQVWGWGTSLVTKGGTDERSGKRFNRGSAKAQTKLAEARTNFGRSIAVNESLKNKLDLAPLTAADAFTVATVAAVEAGQRDAAKIYASGQAAKQKPRLHDASGAFYFQSLGWLMGLEPTTTGITILDSTN